MSGHATDDHATSCLLDADSDSGGRRPGGGRGRLGVERKFATEAEILARLRELSQEVRKVRNEFRDALERAPAPAPRAKAAYARRGRKKR